MNKKQKMKDEHNLDKLFKEGMEEIDIPFREEDWMAMSDQLDQQDKKRVFPLWWALVASAAASVLIFLVFFNTPKNNNTAGRIEKKPSTNVAPKVITPNDEPVYHTRRTEEDSNLAIVTAVTPRRKVRLIADSAIRTLQPVPSSGKIIIEESKLAVLVDEKIGGAALAGLRTGQLRPSEKEMTRMIAPQRLSFTVLAAPDISSTSTSVGNKVSTNFGLTVSYALTKKIGISTGMIYAKKIYNYNGLGATVPGYVGKDWRVDADCKVLDIPINIDYQIFKKRRMAFNVSAGLSSYIMLNEKYQLTNGPGLPVTNEEVTGNKHFLGIANFSVSVERQVNSRLSLGLQPFLKLPLTGIGKYDGNLSSAGLSVLFHIKSLGRNN